MSAPITQADRDVDQSEQIKALEAMMSAADRWHKCAGQNWTQNAIDAQNNGNMELSVQIQNTVLVALSSFPSVAALDVIKEKNGD